ncbi:hypothetical protein JI752_015265 [Lysobacter sp. MMG2]|uniref:hypothetical protein n=1 Tax=Lysobacter sp. MMG2 TaxID=2801338 RepID=UPI001C242AD6|nr:hypothetical protein [Lysobacter sp. MMG2]MBU8977509.1 hypothetical protein [Lysobacter sp. MMG2]
MEAKLDSLAKLIAAAASFAWPVVFAVLLYKLYEPIRNLVDSARGRKFSIKVAGNELSMEEASEQQRQVMSDVQAKLAELEQRLAASPVPVAAAAPAPQPLTTGKRILWVDDNPRNNSFRSIKLEMDALKGRVRQLIDDKHWLTDGEWKETVLRTVPQEPFDPI